MTRISIHDLVAFLLEIAALAVLCWWGFAQDAGVAGRVALGIGAPLAAAVLWGLFAAPRARVKAPLPGVLVVKALVFGSAAAALYGLGHGLLGLAFAVVAAVNTAIVTVERRKNERHESAG
ncbi:YrdB family protein [Bailinhaonella thermotolerans]|nr:YrdB family protein [Bailinhaonella thermotolerans]